MLSTVDSNGTPVIRCDMSIGFHDAFVHFDYHMIDIYATNRRSHRNVGLILFV